jgi:Inverse autotransporter, beta-domain
MCFFNLFYIYLIIQFLLNLFMNRNIMYFNKSIIHWLSLSSYFCIVAASAVEPLSSKKTESTSHRAASISQQWQGQFGQAELNLSKSPADSLYGNMMLLLPIQQDQRQLLFTQGSWHRGNGKTTLNIGIG